MKLLIVLSLVGAAFSASLPTYEYDFTNWIATKGVEAYNKHTRIINGQVVVQNSRPFQAGALTRLPNGMTGLCGGSLISDRAVLTAAHCWFDGTNQGEIMDIVLGALELFAAGQPGSQQTAQIFQTTIVRLHPDWRPSLIRNDIAIARLELPARINSYVQIVALPRNFGGETFAGQTGTISGWGVTEDGNISQHLRLVHTRIITNGICGIAFPFLLQPDNICTSGIGPLGACNGDSGGPVTVQTGHGPVVVGVVSFGSPLGCSANMPTVHARVTSFLDFIYPNI